MIKIICIGKLKEEFKLLEQEYLKKLKSLDKIEILELKEGSGNSKEEITKKEAELIKQKLNGNYIILTEEGKSLTSKEFSNLIKENLTFVIGGAYGLSEELKKNASQIISLSKMTFSHQLARVILLEQIYRSFCIKKNLPYQKD